jgi:predicted nucleotidyltransferase
MDVPSDISPKMRTAILDLLKWLEATETPYVTVGGIAIGLVVGARATLDVDLVLWRDTDTLESFVEAGSKYGFGKRVTDAVQFARKKRVLLLEHLPTGVGIDLSFGALPFEEQMIKRAQTVSIGSVKLNYATPEDLIVMKAISHRPQDIVDIGSILEIERHLDLARIRYWVGEFAAVLEMPELVDDLEKLLAR